MTDDDVLAVVLRFDVPWNLSKLQHTQKCHGVIGPTLTAGANGRGVAATPGKVSNRSESGRPSLRTASGSGSLRSPPHTPGKPLSGA